MEMKPMKRNLRSAVTSMNQTSPAWLVLAAQSTESPVKFSVVSYNIPVWEDVFTTDQWTPKGINGNSHIAGPESRSEGQGPQHGLKNDPKFRDDTGAWHHDARRLVSSSRDGNDDDFGRSNT